MLHSHPHICTLHDVGEHNGTAFLVMELLEGQTLAARLEKGALPLDQALTIAAQVADALDKAHRQGIVHRDLKPANVMLTKAGAGPAGSLHAKLLDFGLAKLRASTGPVNLPIGLQTTTAPGTSEGTILGTVHYMAPEQVKGKEADHCADIWALGALLYEMVTGARPFQGDTAASVIGAILKDSPTPISHRQPLAPALLDRLVAQCLDKDPDRRWQSAADVARALGWMPLMAGPSPESTGARRSRVPIWLAAVAGAAALGLAVGVAVDTPDTGLPSSVRFTVHAEPGTALWGAPSSVVSPHFAISPDGRSLAFAATSKGRSSLWLRPLDSDRARPLAGTEDLRYPFWSPDSSTIAFFAQGKLKTVKLDGALPVARGDATSSVRGGTWLADGTIVMSRRMPASFACRQMARRSRTSLAPTPPSAATCSR